PSQEETIAILQGLKERYENHHNVLLTDEALKAAVIYSSRYIQSQELPDKAIDLMDESAAKVRLDLSDEVTPHQNEMDKLTELVQAKEKATPFLASDAGNGIPTGYMGSGGLLVALVIGLTTGV